MHINHVRRSSETLRWHFEITFGGRDNTGLVRAAANRTRHQAVDSAHRRSICVEGEPDEGVRPHEGEGCIGNFESSVEICCAPTIKKKDTTVVGCAEITLLRFRTAR